VSIAATAIGAIVFTLGLVTSFARNRYRGRLVGLGAMAAGALTALVAADPTSPASWWMAVTGGLTLAGLLVFGAALGRWTAERSRSEGHDTSLLDDDGV
jgi:hypothetical protein